MTEIKIHAAYDRLICNGEFCTCGRDACTCQACGHRFCGSKTTWIERIGNVCRRCLANDPRLGEPAAAPKTN